MQARRRDMKGRAGTAFLFDTAGIHRQTTPVLQPRNVLFLNFHDPAVAIQSLDVEQGRYQPLLLNAAPSMEDSLSALHQMVCFCRAIGTGMLCTTRWRL